MKKASEMMEQSVVSNAAKGSSKLWAKNCPVGLAVWKSFVIFTQAVFVEGWRQGLDWDRCARKRNRK